MQRQLQSELLDSLPADHPDALHNRRDLRLVNLVMGNHRWLARTLPRTGRHGERVLEIGAGTGELGLRLAAGGNPADGLDLWPRPSGWPAARVWHRENLLTFGGYGDYHAIVGNLIFHQFSAEDLAALGSRVRDSVRVILACEPLRRKFSQTLFGLAAPLLGANHVSLHDGRVSIAAGFRGDELPQLLGLDPAAWNWTCRSTLLGAYRMVAVRRSDL
ncbi:MAG: hypothetical protein HY302_12750 [Opitutae bacterium]|nr:hypothetical protein [Opitutae bacterium]